MGTITTGITGLDNMVYSGIPDGSIISIIGPAGSGKTIFSLQFLYANLLQGKKCIYISVAHTMEELVNNSLKFGWDLSPYIENQKLIVKTFELSSMTYSVSGVSPISRYLDELPGFIYSQTADLIILDSITEYLMLHNTNIEHRNKVLNLFQIIKSKRSSALITAELDVESEKSTFGIVEFVADGVISLRRVQSKDMSELIHIIQIAKMRWTKHSREIRQYDITDAGIEVYSKYQIML
ncbi:MAG: gas vesicle protein GvpD [Methanosarcinaceae archaeon]|nr:gas vesicle protein GvpD [Methanosarcinaceae archaeon]